MRKFTDEPVPIDVLERVLETAAWAPSGSNLQPWHIYVVTGEPLARLKKIATERVANGDPWDEREFTMYPDEMRSPYVERRNGFGRDRYSALGIVERRLGVASARRHRELGLLRRARRTVLLHRPRPRPTAMGRRGHVSAVGDAAPSRGGSTQLPADGVVAGPQDRRRHRVAAGRAHALLRDVDRLPGPAEKYIRTGRAPIEETVTFIED